MPRCWPWKWLEINDLDGWVNTFGSVRYVYLLVQHHQIPGMLQSFKDSPNPEISTNIVKESWSRLFLWSIGLFQCSVVLERIPLHVNFSSLRWYKSQSTCIFSYGSAFYLNFKYLNKLDKLGWPEWYISYLAAKKSFQVFSGTPLPCDVFC